MATASFDDGVEVSGRLDAERALLVSNLIEAGAREIGQLRIVDALEGTNAAGDPFTTDGRATFLSLPPTGGPKPPRTVNASNHDVR